MTLANAKILYKSLLERGDEYHAKDQLRRYPELKDITLNKPDKVAETAPKEPSEPVQPTPEVKPSGNNNSSRRKKR